jgi:feruloyl esterase
MHAGNQRSRESAKSGSCFQAAISGRVEVLLGCLIAFIFLVVFPSCGRANASCESLAALKLPDTIITAAAAVSAGPFTIPGPAPAAGRPPREAPVLPAFCRVEAIIKPAIKFEVWLPTAWNGNLQAVGNGGFAGSISYQAMVAALVAGYATASTDTGHTGADSSWALGHPELVVDYGYRAIHEMTLQTKKIIEAFYGAGPRVSYFNGCSNGGRQGLMEAQRYPADYDGILAGAPANYLTHLYAGGMLWLVIATLKDPESYIPTNKLAAIESASLASCDSLDGLNDGLISDPRKCKFDPEVLRCKGADSATCLTDKQVEALKNIYSGPPPVNGKPVFPGKMPGGETGWATYMPTAAKNISYNLSVGFFKDMVYEDSNWDFREWDFATGLPYTEKKLAGILDAVDPNLKAFRAHDGKLLLYQGWSDPAVAPLNAVNYYKSVVAALTGKDRRTFEPESGTFLQANEKAEDGVRLFMVPGMSHCGGGPGPNKFDAFTPLVNWVEHKQAPDRIVASHATNEAVDRTRPLCPYPATAQYTGHGSIDDAANFVCRVPGASVPGSN